MPPRNERRRACNPAMTFLVAAQHSVVMRVPGSASLEFLPRNQQYSQYDQRGGADLARRQLLDIFEKD
jgi:hypothetical protein